MQLLLERRGTRVSLLPAIKDGGEGSIHPIEGEPKLIAKVFTQPSQERGEKLRAMLDNPPVFSSNTPVTVAWPLDRLLNGSGECVGYVMSYVKDKQPLYRIYHPSYRPKWANFAFMLRTAKNVSLAVSGLHRHGYVVGDINELNILVGPDASVAVVDTDSIQVRTTRRIFRCLVGTPGFTPAELCLPGLSFEQVDRQPHHDAFGIGVLVFLLLMNGNHPFAAQCVRKGGRQTQTQRIAQGQWPYTSRPNAPYRPRRNAPPLETLSPEIRVLMRRCFDAGHHSPASRPTADEWHQALTNAEQEWDTIRARLRYGYHRFFRPGRWGQSILAVPSQVKHAARCIPVKVWLAVFGALCFALLYFAMLSWTNRTQPPWPSGTKENSAQISGPAGELNGEATPWLWQEAQRQNRMKK